MKWETLDKYETVKTWLEVIDPKPNTRRNYLTGLQEYVDFTGLNPDELLAEADREVTEGVLARDRMMKKRLIGFRQELKRRGLAVNTRRNHFSGVRSFYKSFDHEIPNVGREEKAIPKAEHLDIPSKEDIRQALKACDLRDKAIILCGCSSGLGAADIVNLTVEQFNKGYDSETEITTFFIRREKSSTDFVTFISPEASRAVHEYLKYRNREANTNDRYRLMQLEKQKSTNNKGYLFIKRSVDDEYLSSHDEESRKLDTKGLLKAYRVLSERAQKSTAKGVWNLIRSHNMRKFFNTTLKNAGFDSERVEFFMGHTLDGTKGAYYRAEADKLKTLYAAFVPYLTIQRELDVTSSPEYQKLQTENQDLKAAKEFYRAERGELTSIKGEIDALRAELRDREVLKSRIRSEYDRTHWEISPTGERRFVTIGTDEMCEVGVIHRNLKAAGYSGNALKKAFEVQLESYIDNVVSDAADIVLNDRKLKAIEKLV